MKILTNRTKMTSPKLCSVCILQEISYPNLNVHNILFNKEWNMEDCTNFQSTKIYLGPTQTLNTFYKESQLESPNKSMCKLLTYWKLCITLMNMVKSLLKILPVNLDKNSQIESKKPYRNKLIVLTKNIKWTPTSILSWDSVLLLILTKMLKVDWFTETLTQFCNKTTQIIMLFTLMITHQIKLGKKFKIISKKKIFHNQRLRLKLMIKKLVWWKIFIMPSRMIAKREKSLSCLMEMTHLSEQMSYLYWMRFTRKRKLLLCGTISYK